MPATFKFYIRDDRKDDRGTCPIYLRITHNRKRKYINTGIRLKPDQWHPGNEQVRKNYGTKAEVHKVNKRLSQIRSDAEDAYWQLDEEKKASADAIKKRLKYASKDNFFDLAADYLEEIKPESFYNWKQSRVAINKLKEFHGSKHLPVNLIDKEFLDEFVKKHLQQKMKNKASTIEKNFNPIRNILDVAVSKHLIAENPAKGNGFSLPKKNGSKSKPKLSFEQIQQLENLKLNPDSNLWHSRNSFVLSFYFCGIRFGDLAMLRWQNVKGGRLKYTMSKTGTDIDVKMPEGAKAILDYYDRPNKSDDDFIFPFLSDLNKREQKNPEIVRKRISSWNAVINGQDSGGKLSGLKAVADKLEWDKSLSYSMHAARHSFSQYAVEEREVPVYRMMILLGHQNIKTTMNYLKTINVKAADDAMDAIF